MTHILYIPTYTSLPRLEYNKYPARWAGEEARPVWHTWHSGSVIMSPSSLHDITDIGANTVNIWDQEFFIHQNWGRAVVEHSRDYICCYITPQTPHHTWPLHHYMPSSPCLPPLHTSSSSLCGLYLASTNISHGLHLNLLWFCYLK